MVGVFVAFIRVVYGRMIYMSLPDCFVPQREDTLVFFHQVYSKFPFASCISNTSFTIPYVTYLKVHKIN